MKSELEYEFDPDSYWGNGREIDVLLGKTLTDVSGGFDEITFTTSDGFVYKMHHSQDCCESVSIESIVGDLQDLVGSPITLAEEVSGDTPSDYKFEYEPESYTWTFYKIATVKGYVDIRWLGQSNGYYSESVNFDRIK